MQACYLFKSALKLIFMGVAAVVAAALISSSTMRNSSQNMTRGTLLVCFFVLPLNVFSNVLASRVCNL